MLFAIKIQQWMTIELNDSESVKPLLSNHIVGDNEMSLKYDGPAHETVVR